MMPWLGLNLLPAPVLRAGTYLRLVFAENAQTLSNSRLWNNPTKGFGFIVPDDGGNNIFVHISAVEQAGLTTLGEGQKVQFEL